MEETVNIQTPEAPATVFAFGPEEGSRDDASMTEEVTNTADETVVEPEGSEGADGPEGEENPQKKIGWAFASQRRRMQEEYDRKLEQDPVRQLGMLMVEDLRAGGNLSLEEAVEQVRTGFIQAVAKRENISPVLAQKLFSQNVQPMQEQTPEQQADAEANRIVQEVEAAKKPEGFNAEKAFSDPEFINLVTTMPAEAAIRLYHAEQQLQNQKQDLAEKMRARKAVPQPMGNAAPVKQVTDWMEATDEQFWEEYRRRERNR